jgi:predicted RNase H-like nuclease
VTTHRVLGVDACRAGWVGVVLHEEGGARAPAEARVEAHVEATIDALVARASERGGLDAVAVDIPIGLPDAGRRRADVLARAQIGPLRSSVFMTPVRAALLAPDHATAVRANRALAGEGVSIQAYALRVKLLQVDAWVRTVGLPVVEAHPEVSFARMHGGPLTSRKATWAGGEVRRRLLAEQGVVLAGELGLDGQDAGADDVLDAGAAAWTARRVARGEAEPLPDPPEVFDDGWPAAIWV